MNRGKESLLAALLGGLLCYLLGFWVVKLSAHPYCIELLATFSYECDGWQYLLLGAAIGFVSILLYRSVKSP